MNHVVRVFVERAQARRASLLDLATAIPEDFWTRRPPGEPWGAYRHLAHALSADAGVNAMIPAFISSSFQRFQVTQLLAERAKSIASAEALDFPALLDFASTGRREVIDALTRIEQDLLESEAAFIDERSEWAQPVALSLFAYLDQWATHDSAHESAIRAAIATSPDLSAIAHTRRLK